MLGGREKSLPVFLQRQDARLEPAAEFMAMDECKHLRDTGRGEFINRGKAFRRYDRSHQPDAKKYEPSGRRGASLKIAEPPPHPQHVQLGMMSRYVEETLLPVRERNRAVLTAIASWAPKEMFVQEPSVEPPVFPYVFRWYRAPKIRGKREQLRGRRCRIVARGRRTDAVMLQFEDKLEYVTSRSAIVLAKVKSKTEASHSEGN